MGASACAGSCDNGGAEAINSDELKVKQKVGAIDEPALAVGIVGARGLRNADWLPGTGKSDTYLVMKMDGRELHTTQVVQDCLEPFWRENVDIPDWTPDKVLEFKIYDKDYTTSDYLGKVILEPSGYAEEGFNGELAVDEAGDDVRAYLRLKIKVAGKELPPAPPTELTITADKNNYQTWGLDLDTQDNELLFVTQVRPGPFTDANEKLAPADQIIKSDFVMGVNDVKGSPAALLNEFKQSRTVKLDLARSVETTICFVYHNKSLPLGLQFPSQPSGEALAVISVDEESAASAYNEKQENEMLRINPGDRIIAVGGYRGKAGELADKMEQIKKKGKCQVEIMRATGEEAKAHFGLH